MNIVKAVAKTVLCAAALVIRMSVALEPGMANTTVTHVNTTVTHVPLTNNSTNNTSDNTPVNLAIAHSVAVGDKENASGVSIDHDDGVTTDPTCSADDDTKHDYHTIVMANIVESTDDTVALNNIKGSTLAQLVDRVADLVGHGSARESKPFGPRPARRPQPSPGPSRVWAKVGHAHISYSVYEATPAYRESAARREAMWQEIDKIKADPLEEYRGVDMYATAVDFSMPIPNTSSSVLGKLMFDKDLATTTGTDDTDSGSSVHSGDNTAGEDFSIRRSTWLLKYPFVHGIHEVGTPGRAVVYGDEDLPSTTTANNNNNNNNNNETLVLKGKGKDERVSREGTEAGERFFKPHARQSVLRGKEAGGEEESSVDRRHPREFQYVEQFRFARPVRPWWGW